MRQFKVSRFKELEYWRYLLDCLLKRPNTINGLIPYEPKGTDEIYYEGKTHILGYAYATIFPKLNPIDYVSASEKQNRNGRYDKMACVTYSGHNSIEATINRLCELVYEGTATEEQKGIVAVMIKYGLVKKTSDTPVRYETNVSERYIAKMSGTTYRGNSQKNVADTIRHYGMVPEEAWPWVDDWDEYYADVPEEIIAMGKKVVEYLEITYEWFEAPQLKSISRFGLAQTSGYAWPLVINGLYSYSDMPKNHAFCVDRKFGDHIRAEDSYEPHKKKLNNNYNLGWMMVFNVYLKKPLDGADLEVTNNPEWDTSDPMTNVKIVRRNEGDTAEYGFYQPCDSEEAFRSLAKNYAVSLPMDASGKILWEELQEDGTIALYKKG